MRKPKIYLDTSILSHLKQEDVPDKMEDKPILSAQFTMDDIRKLRDYNSARHAGMTLDELREDMRPNLETFMKHMEGRAEKQKLYNEAS